ncbi:TSUP family transporter [Alteromonas halophila]|uniref:Probable membrane transporter protein n=1 Tax=Alteromonas halophila TaxID=516698 RepID=A0A918JIV8_9ALTE|nr:TSUP family transporter [Alteromonas halophila]GGW78083.1 hypothetical protein GCM10007391_08300 [Alteromonas halophila]
MDPLLTILTAGGEISASTAILLIGLSALTSLLTATLGAGGGMLLLAVMASVVPLSALIPVHGLVQLGSNANRALMTWSHIDVKLLCYFSIGALLGAILASFIVVQLPLLFIQVAVAGFILFLVWGGKPKAQNTGTSGRILAGLTTTVITMFVGATGPLVAAFVHRSQNTKLRLTATFASCMTVQNVLKAFVFTFIGFSFWQWAGLIGAMIVSGALGTWLGLHVLQKIPLQRFVLLFKLVITLLALRLLVDALLSLT